ncbi:MAG: WG repeat-containing protein [Bacteroidales bacterium]|nr:WG repeat-containing protein [Bacteroidales bacterium]
MKKIKLFLAEIFMLLFAFSCGAQVNNYETEEIDSLGEKTEKMNSIDEEKYESDIIPWERNGKIGWVSAKDTNIVVIPFDYDALLAFVPYPEAAFRIFYSTKDLEQDAERILQTLWAMKEGKWGTIEGFGGNIPFVYDEIEFFEHDKSFGYYYEEDDSFVIIKDGLKGCASINGEILVPCKYDSIRREGNGTSIIFCKGGKYGARCGNIYVPCVYEDIWRINPLLSSEEDESNTKETGSIYSRIVFKAVKDGKSVFINDAGIVETKLPPWLEDFEAYGDGIYLLKKNGKWGAMRDGICSELKYDSIEPIDYIVEDGLGSERHSEIIFTGFYYVYLNGKQNILTSDMKPVLNSEIVSYKLVPENDLFYETWPSKVLLVKNKKNYWGIINGEGKQIVPCKYDKIKPLENGCFELVKGKNRTEVNADGKPCI